MKKRILTFVLALVSVCALCFSSVPGSLAFIVDRTQPLVNTFTPAGSPEQTVSTAVNITKTVVNTGDGAIGPEGFRFALKELSSGSEFFAESDSFGFACFPLTFFESEAGQTFVYQLYEIDTGRAGVTYSDEVHTVEITVTGGEVLTAQVRINGAPSTEASFCNVYDSSIAPPLPDTGDSMNPALCAAMLACSLLGLAITAAARRKEEVR